MKGLGQEAVTLFTRPFSPRSLLASAKPAPHRPQKARVQPTPIQPTPTFPAVKLQGVLVENTRAVTIINGRTVGNRLGDTTITIKPGASTCVEATQTRVEKQT